MSTIDELIACFHADGAERLLLVSGKAPVLTVDDDLRPMQEGPIERHLLEGMILIMGGESETGQEEFTYDAPTGEIQVTTRVTERLIQIIIVPPTIARTEDAGVATHPAQTHDLAEAGLEAASIDPGRDLPAPDEEFQKAFLEDPEVGHFASDGAVGQNGEPDGSDPSVLAGPDAVDDSPVDRIPVEPFDQVDDAAPPVLEVRPDAPAMERLFLKMVGKGCSDLHLSAGSIPLFRKDGRIADLGGEPKLTPGQAEALLMGITPERFRKAFEASNDVDFAYEIPGVARFRCNLFRDRKGMGGVFRQVPAEILTAEQLGLDQQLLDMCRLKKGLILVTGPTGSGKSTTLAALIDHINRTREDHIITIEDPIEFVHENQKCLINQREIGEHTESFKVALRAALREDPDIVLVGELRDLETVEIALETAETGHLVFGTLHTNTAAGTVSRLIDQFPAGQQAQIRTMLADTLQAVVSQTLCRKIRGGRVAALEILVVTNAVANLIREDKTHQILSAMQTGGKQGMRTLNDALLDLVKMKIVDPTEAYWNAVDKGEFLGVASRKGVKIPELKAADVA